MCVLCVCVDYGLIGSNSISTNLTTLKQSMRVGFNLSLEIIIDYIAVHHVIENDNIHNKTFRNKLGDSRGYQSIIIKGGNALAPLEKLKPRC